MAPPVPAQNGSAFIDLDRRFRQLNLSGDQEDAAFRSYTALLGGDDNSLAWSDLLAEGRVVVLGEPGSGKTWELEEQARLLKHAGKFAFFIRLDTVPTQGVREGFQLEERHHFDSWLKGREPGTLLLDSVDESKMQTQEGFALALKRVRNEVGSALTRCTLIISSRISEWRPHLDQHEVLRLFPQQGHPPQQGNQESEQVSPPLKIVQIEPLDAKRVTLFAQSRGVTDVDPFLKALDNHNAWEFSRRPVDVTSLLNFWQVHGRLGTLTELIEHDIAFKLSETRDREFISPEQARQGAEMLAASVVLCRQLNIKIADDTHVPAEAGLSPALCLPASWTPAEARALLSRAIFDAACYGHQRFHHRRTSEYLAASWLNNLMGAGCPLDTLEQLLFATTGGRRIIRPSLAPVTAWLAHGNDPWHRHVREWILDAAPWLHLHLGDPEVLPVDYKRQLLHAIVQRFQGRDLVRIDWTTEGLTRFADPGLAADVAGLIQDPGIADDLRADLLMLVSHGRLLGCMDAALAIMANPGETDNVKIYAAAAIRDTGELPHRRQLASVVEQWAALSERLCAPICEALYPTAIDEQGLLALLAKCETPSDDGVGLRYYLEDHLTETLRPERAGALLAGLIGFAQQPPLIQDSLLSHRNHWVTGLFHSLLLKLFTCPSLNAEEISVAVSTLYLLEDGLEHTGYRHSLTEEEKTSLSATIMRHPEVRRAYLWSAVACCRQKHSGDPLHALHLFGYYSVMARTVEDLPWLIADLGQRHEFRDQALALRLALPFAWHQGSWPRRLSHLRLIRGAIKSTPGLKPLFWSQIKDLALQPLRAFWYLNLHRRLKSKYWWKKKFRSVQQAVTTWQDKWVFLRRRAWLRNAERIDWLANLSRHAGDKHRHRRSPSNFNGLTNKYGRLITTAVRQGCENAWSGYWPALPHEKEEPHETGGRVIVGLCGLQSLVLDQTIDFAALKPKEAERAARYALNELNGFPDWLPELAQQQPTAVQKLLATAIRGEWQYPAERQHVHDVVADLVYRGEYLWELIAEELARCLRAGDPPHPEMFAHALTLIFQSKALTRTEIAALAQDRLHGYAQTSRHYFLWLGTWIQTDAAGALGYIEDLVQTLALPAADTLILDLCDSISARRHGRCPQVEEPDYAGPRHLSRLTKLVYRHVRPSDDIEWATGGRPISTRNDVQRFRSSLLETLAASNAPCATDALQELLTMPELSSRKDWILHLLDKRAERLADGRPWRETDIREFAKAYEIAPRTDHELFRIACNRLRDLKREIERSENSPRAEVRKEWEETELRRWFQRKLRETSRSRYTVPQEAEIDMGKKADLRFECAGIDGTISVELKWAENWTYKELIERLENQLVGQYLRAHNARYGIFLLGYIGRQSFWKGPDGGNKNFADLVESIRSHAARLKKSRPDIEGVEVIGIDFVPPYGATVK